jgi:capsular polysaccharide biosynthesis protein
MDIRLLWRILLRRWWIVVAPVVVVLVFVVVTYRPPPTTYQVVMRFSAGTLPAGLSEEYDRYYPWLTSEYIANGLADVAEAGVFAQEVARRAAQGGVAVDAAAVRGAIVTDNAQSIMVVYFTWPDCEQARALAWAVADELSQNGSAYFPQLDWLDPAVRLLDEPAPVALPPSLRAQLLGPVVRLGLALAVGIGLALAWHYLDPTVHEPGELEALGIPVLARIPRRRRKA